MKKSVKQITQSQQSIYILDLKKNVISERISNKFIPPSLSHHTTTLMNNEIWIIGGIVRYSSHDYHQGYIFHRKVCLPKIVVINVNSKESFDLTDEIKTDIGE